MTKKVVLIVIGVVALLVCGVGGALVYYGVGFGKDYADTEFTAAQFDAQQIGKPENEVRQALPEAMEWDEKDLYGTDPTRQGKLADASYVYHPVKPLTEAGDQPMYRFCFVGGELTEKKKIRTQG